MVQQQEVKNIKNPAPVVVETPVTPDVSAEVTDVTPVDTAPVKGTGDADGDLMQLHDFEARPLGKTVNDCAAAHGEECAQAVGSAPKKPQQKRPKESSF